MSVSFQEKINRLTIINEHPEQFIIEYYDDLKWRIDTYFTNLKEDENLNEESPSNQDWLDYIEFLECNQKCKTENINEVPFISFKSEIDDLKQNYNEENFEKIQFKLESAILQSSSILFYTNYNGRTILVIVEDQYIPQRVFETFSYQHLNKDYINMHYVLQNLRLHSKHRSHLLTNFNVLYFKLNLHCIRDFSINEKDIETIEINVFQNMPNIETVDFSKNKIKEIAKYFFSQYSRIDQFDFGQNQITKLPNYLFENVDNSIEKYKTLKITKRFIFIDNLITTVDPLILKQFNIRWKD